MQVPTCHKAYLAAWQLAAGGGHPFFSGFFLCSGSYLKVWQKKSKGEKDLFHLNMEFSSNNIFIALKGGCGSLATGKKGGYVARKAFLLALIIFWRWILVAKISMEPHFEDCNES